MGGSGEGRVAGEERAAEQLGERHVGGVVNRQVRSRLPGARDQEPMGIPFEPQVGEVLQGFGRALGGDGAAALVAPEHLRDLEVEELRRVKVFGRVEEAGADCDAEVREQEHLEQDRGVDDDQRASRSARTALAAETAAVTASRDRMRAQSSADVGCSTDRRRSASR